MTADLSCKNCGITVTHVYCHICGQKTDVGPLDLKAFLEELLVTFLNGPRRQLYTFWQMILKPGPNILEYLDGKRKSLQSPLSYFVFAIFLYYLFSNNVLVNMLSTEPFKTANISVQDISHATELNDSISLFIILLGMSFIGYFFCGINWGAQNRRSYNFIEALVVFAFIYGTNFILDIPIVFVEVYTPILKILLHYTNDKDVINLLTDIPLIVIIAVMAFKFCKSAGIGLHRYFLTLLFGLLYYRFITSHLHW